MKRLCRAEALFPEVIEKLPKIIVRNQIDARTIADPLVLYPLAVLFQAPLLLRCYLQL
jgi:hypothetical protein